MKLLGLEGKGLLISVGITIIMCGAVTYYCHMRVKNVEVALMKQNQVLSSFITNVQGEIRKGGLSDTRTDVSSPEARNAVKNLENSKIEVSDDDDDSASETDASETDASETDASETDASETDDETDASETDDKTEMDHEGSANKNSTIKDIKIVDIHLQHAGLLNDFTSNNKIIELTDLEEITEFVNIRDETDDDSDDDSISDVESVSAISINQEFKKINISDIIVDHKQEPLVNSVNVEEVVVEVDLVAVTEVDAESNDFIKKIVKTEDKEKEKTSNINKMKIDDLREKVILSGLGTVESVKKLKKSDLITLLTENK
jgi:hypothetical protein